MIRTLVFAALFGLALETSAAVGALSFVPSTREVQLGATFTVAVQGTFDTDVLGGGLVLTVTPAPGSPASGLADIDAIFDEDVWFLNHFDDATLRAEFGSMTPPQGTFTILEYEFHAAAAGTYLLGLELSSPFLTGAAETITMSLPPCATCEPALPAGRITVVPEPASVGMLLAGLAVVLMRLRRVQ
jgi:hypothetical protein